MEDKNTEKILVIGAGVTGCYTAARLSNKGMDVSVLARGEKADRFAREGIQFRDGITGEERTVHLPILTAPVKQEFHIAMACIQDIHRPAVEDLIAELPGRPIVWFLGNTTRGYERTGELLGRDRVLGGFPSVGGTWDEDVLVYADKQKPADEPFDELVAGEAFPEAEKSLKKVRDVMQAAGQKIRHYSPIMAWHWCHVALILPLAGVVYGHNGDLEASASDKPLLKKSIRAVVQGFDAVKRKDYPVLPGKLKAIKIIPASLGARKVAKTLKSPFGRIALAGHAETARDEMRHLTKDFLAFSGENAGRELRELLELV